MKKHLPLLALVAAPAMAQDATPASTLKKDLEHIVVTSAGMEQPGVVITDPKAPQQPLPAHDGADYLKTIPGFSIARKGGASSEALFRGMGASRINILTDGQTLLGGCANRMDPPTAYISPQSFDQIKVIKGPESVLYGPASATVLFEKKNRRFTGPDAYGDVSATVAQYGRREASADITAGNRDGFARLAATKSRADNYRDGSGNEVNSHYDRWSTDAELGWTPTDDTLVMLSAGRSNGEAAYADRGMDGTKFDRTNLGLKVRVDHLTSWLTRLETQVFFNYIDHVMDNYSLRTFTPSMMMPHPMAINPDRYTRGGRIQADLALAPRLSAKVGLDTKNNAHRQRSTMNALMMPYQDKPRLADGKFKQSGVFAELTYQLAANRRLISGARLDHWQAWDQRMMLMPGMMTTLMNPTYGDERQDNLPSGFVRLETTSAHSTWYAGIGHAERFPDYWEIIGNSRASENSDSAFYTAPEKNTQLDLGWISQRGPLRAEVSLYYSRINDFILIESASMMSPSLVRNIDAENYGGEASLRYKLTDAWQWQASLAYSHGQNLTDHRPLAQMPPLEVRLGTDYAVNDWTFGALWRLVAAQHRVAVGQGTVIGTDIGKSAGFGVFSLNANWRPAEHWQLSLGVDNLFDKTYAEHLSRAGAAIAGFDQTTRVNEPGRTAWAQVAYRF